MSPVKKIIIIGAGSAGLVAAIRLKTFNGLDVEVYELRAVPTTLGGAINIPSNGLLQLNRLGIYDDLARRGSSASHLKVHSMQGSTLVDMDMAGWSREKTGFGFMRILRTDLMDVLLETAKKHNIPVHFGKRMTRVDETDNDVVATFEDGTTVAADLLLGCDGIHSSVRTRHVDQTNSPEYSGISNMFAILPWTSNALETHGTIAPALHATLTPEGMFGVMPCTASGDHVYWFYSREVPVPQGEGNREGWEAFGKKEVEGFKDNVLMAINDATGQWADQLREVVRKTEKIKFYPIYKMPPAAAWSTKRCLLMGDAAHAMQPHAGQGTSMALEDAFMLSRLLKDGTPPLSEVFQKYEAIRRPRVEAIGRASTDNGEIRKNTTSLALRMKEMALGAGFWLYRTAGLQKWGIGMNQKDFAYDIMAEPI